MELTGYYIRIAKFIALEITDELSKSEQEELNKWLSTSKENEHMYNRIRSEIAGLIENNKKINVQSEIAWNKIIQETVLKKKPQSPVIFFKYAAVFLIAIISSVAIYYNYTKNSDADLAAHYSSDTELQPGSQRALLVTSDGSNVELDKERNDTIREEDGSFIQNNNNILTYNNAAKPLPKAKKQHDKIIYNTLITPKGGEYNLVLADGTKIWVNADSKLEYPVRFPGATREIELEGEAYFEVEKNVNKPFIIKTKEYTVEVLGTTFNLWAYKEDDKVMTTLVEGSVKIKNFDDSGNEVIIKPEEQLILNKVEKGIHIRKVNPLDYTAWKDGRFIFVKQSLDDILKILSRWYNFDTEFESDELKEIVFTGNMDRYEDLSMPLEMISKTNKVNFKFEGRKVLVTHRK